MKKNILLATLTFTAFSFSDFVAVIDADYLMAEKPFERVPMSDYLHSDVTETVHVTDDFKYYDNGNISGNYYSTTLGGVVTFLPPEGYRLIAYVNSSSFYRDSNDHFLSIKNYGDMATGSNHVYKSKTMDGSLEFDFLCRNLCYPGHNSSGWDISIEMHPEPGDMDGDGFYDDIDPDADGDGANTEEEVYYGTDPFDGTDIIQIKHGDETKTVQINEGTIGKYTDKSGPLSNYGASNQSGVITFIPPEGKRLIADVETLSLFSGSQKHYVSLTGYGNIAQGNIYKSNNLDGSLEFDFKCVNYCYPGDGAAGWVVSITYDDMPGDIDGDGILDDVDPDADGDGANTEEEAYYGTDPFDGTDIIQIKHGDETKTVQINEGTTGKYTDKSGPLSNYGAANQSGVITFMPPEGKRLIADVEVLSLFSGSQKHYVTLTGYGNVAQGKTYKSGSLDGSLEFDFKCVNYCYPGDGSAGWVISITYDDMPSDMDGDGILDDVDPDADGDGANTEEEAFYGSDPLNATDIIQIKHGDETKTVLLKGDTIGKYTDKSGPLANYTSSNQTGVITFMPEEGKRLVAKVDVLSLYSSSQKHYVTLTDFGNIGLNQTYKSKRVDGSLEFDFKCVNYCYGSHGGVGWVVSITSEDEPDDLDGDGFYDE